MKNNLTSNNSIKKCPPKHAARCGPPPFYCSRWRKNTIETASRKGFLCEIIWTLSCSKIYVTSLFRKDFVVFVLKGFDRKIPRGEGNRKKPKNSKKDRKITLLSLYVLYLYHVWKSRGGHGPLPLLPMPMFVL